jgi:hypothetical protein
VPASTRNYRSPVDAGEPVLRPCSRDCPWVMVPRVPEPISPTRGHCFVKTPKSRVTLMFGYARAH